MKQNTYTFYHALTPSPLGERAGVRGPVQHPSTHQHTLSASIHAFFTRAVIPAQAGIYRKPFSLTSPFPRTWNQRIEQRNALARLNSHLLADTGISEAQRIAEVNKPFWRA